MVPKYVVLDKKLGQTPLEAIREWKAAHPEHTEMPASYAGRLDPMATGLLLVLLGDECKRKDSYTGLDKEYEIEVLLDVGSDTGDVLGIVSAAEAMTNPERSALLSLLRKEKGAHQRAYPAFSSKTVEGTPLFLHALQGTLATIEIPLHEERIYDLRLQSAASLTHAELQARITGMLSHAPVSSEPSKELGADFRIHAVRNSWQTVFLQPDRSYGLLRLRVTCSTGTYMRTLAERMGTALGTRALARSIRRTRIGTYARFGPFGFWTRQFRLTTY
ncbi:MAG: ine55 [Parcubacteria group bacterium]|nr:ine55 [Parcubacteria group bacterium]